MGQEQRFGEAIALFGKYAGFGLPSKFLESDAVMGPRALYACFARKADESDTILGWGLAEGFDSKDGLLPARREKIFALHTGRSVEEDDQIESLLWRGRRSVGLERARKSKPQPCDRGDQKEATKKPKPSAESVLFGLSCGAFVPEAKDSLLPSDLAPIEPSKREQQ